MRKGLQVSKKKFMKILLTKQWPVSLSEEEFSEDAIIAAYGSRISQVSSCANDGALAWSPTIVGPEWIPGQIFGNYVNKLHINSDGSTQTTKAVVQQPTPACAVAIDSPHIIYLTGKSDSNDNFA